MTVFPDFRLWQRFCAKWVAAPLPSAATLPPPHSRSSRDQWRRLRCPHRGRPRQPAAGALPAGAPSAVRVGEADGLLWQRHGGHFAAGVSIRLVLYPPGGSAAMAASASVPPRAAAPICSTVQQPGAPNASAHSVGPGVALVPGTARPCCNCRPPRHGSGVGPDVSAGASAPRGRVPLHWRTETYTACMSLDVPVRP